MKTQLTFHHLFKDQKGSVLAMAAAGILALIVVAGAAIDISRYLTVKSKFNHAVDQALLAAASVSNTQDVNQVAQRFFKANFPTQYGDSVILDNIQVTSVPNSMQWSATATATLKTSFGALVGADNIRLSHTARVQWDQSTMELVFVVGINAAMCATLDPDARQKGVMKVLPDDACTKLNQEKSALRYFIAGDSSVDTSWPGLPILTTQDGRPAYKVGFVPYNHKVKMPDPSNVPPLICSVENTDPKGDPNYFQNFTDAETNQYPLASVAPLVALTQPGDRDKLLQIVDGLKTYWTVPGWTRSTVGMLTASLMLDPDYFSFYGGGAKPEAFGTPRNEKTVVLLTDGANMGCCFSSHPDNNFDNQYLYTYRTDNAYLAGDDGNQGVGLCDAMKQQGITIYTIAYDVDDRDPGGQRIKQVLQKCASGQSGNMFYFDVKRGDEQKMRDAYKNIAQSLLRLRITY